jgi:hypothetical protein
MKIVIAMSIGVLSRYVIKNPSKSLSLIIEVLAWGV